MREMGAFQVAQMKHRNARVLAICQHLRSAIDCLEQIASEPYKPPEKPMPEPVVTPPPPPLPSLEIPREKLTYTMKEASAALSISRTTLWRAIGEGKLPAVKFGSRTLIPADTLRQWMASLPSVKPRADQKNWRAQRAGERLGAISSV